MTDYVMKQRLAKAAALVLGMFLCVLALDAAVEAGQAAAFAQEEKPGIDAQEIIGDGDAARVLDRLELVASAAEVQLPEAFEEEVGLPDACRDVRVSPDRSIVGCVVDGAAEDVLDAIRAHLCAGGWREVPLQGVEGGTFVKKEGTCTWVLVTCTQVGEAVNVVYRCMYR